MRATESYEIVFLDTYVNSKGITMYKYQLQGEDFASYKIAQGNYYREFQGKPLYFSKYNLGKEWVINHSLPSGFDPNEYTGSYWPYKPSCSDCKSSVNLEFGESTDGNATVVCQYCEPTKYWEAYWKNKKQY